MFRRLLPYCIMGILACGAKHSLADDTLSVRKQVDSLILYADTLSAEPETAGAVSQRALTLSRSIRYTDGIARACLSLGSIYMSRGYYDSARNYFRLGIKAVEPPADTPARLNKAMLECGIAGSYMFASQTDSAADYAYRSLNTLREWGLSNHKKSANIYNNIAGLWLLMNDKQQTLAYLKKAEALIGQDSTGKVIAMVYLNLCSHYSSRGQKDSATYYLNRAQSAGKGQLVVPSLLSLAKFRLYQNRDTFGAINLLKNILELTREEHKELGMSACYHLGVAYQAAGQYRKAEEAMLRGLSIQDSLGTMRHFPDFYDGLAQLYVRMGRYKEAYGYANRSKEALKNIWAREKQEYINDLEAKYSSAQKDKQLAENSMLVMQQQHGLRQKNFWIISISSVTLLLSIIFGLIYRNGRQKQLVQSATIDTLQKDRELTSLQSELEGELKERRRIARELHDGVASIIGSARMHMDLGQGREHIDEQAYRQGLNLLDDAYLEIRHIAHNLVPEQLLAQGFIAALEAYCLKISRAGVFSVSFRHSGGNPELPSATALSLFRIVQELLHNAQKHGKAGEVLVDCSAAGGELMITVEDNGSGLPPDYETGSGNGLRNLRERADAISCRIDIYNRKDKGASFYLFLPFHSTTS